MIDGIDIIEHIARYNIKENKYACILSYVICDHLLSVLYLAMYCAEEDVLDRERNVISSYRHIENSVCILNKILFSVFDNKIEYSNLDSLVKELKSISFEDMDIIRENEKFLLELDNYNTIYEAVYNIIDNLKVKAQKIDKVIYFAYGGISLGYAFKTIMKELFDKNVELLPSHYSSKRNNTESGIIDRIPRFKCGENGWMDESTVLLLDNNVTTFKTLSTSKSYLQKRGNKVYCAVAEVDYKNIDTMKDTGYYRRSPQYTMFCSDVTEDFEDLEKMSNASFVDKNLDEVIQIPSFSLSPSACFHVYEKYRGQTMPQNSVITLNQSVFRNEGRLNWEEFGRLRDYHVREIVFLGTQEFVEQTRENIREEVMTFIRKMNMDAYITVAADAFIMPKMIKYKKYQKMEKSKYEVRVSYDKDHTLAAASLNLHGTAFTSPFHIKVKGVDNPVSGCVGFGIERWILVFLAQYGTDSACWPDEVKKFIRQKG